MKMPPTSRRQFLRTSAALAAAAPFAAPSLFAAEDYGGHSIPVALQLYTIRSETTPNGPDKAFESVAKWGYKGVEFAGYYGRDAKGVKDLLDKNGLIAVGTHLPGGYGDLSGDKLKAAVEFNHIIGNKRLIVAMISGQLVTSKDSIKGVTDTFNSVAEKLKSDGMFVGYHCHPGDFRKIDDEYVWDLLFTNMSKDVIMQCDLGHMGTAGVDPVAYLNKYPGRAKTVHVKPSARTRNLLLGEDELKWPEIFKACESVGGTEVYIVEYDGGTMEKAQKTFDIMHKWGKC